MKIDRFSSDSGPEQASAFGLIPVEAKHENGEWMPKIYSEDGENFLRIPNDAGETVQVGSGWFTSRPSWVPANIEDGETYQRFPAWVGISSTVENQDELPLNPSLSFSRGTGNGIWGYLEDSSNDGIETTEFKTSRNKLDPRHQPVGSLNLEFNLDDESRFYDDLEGANLHQERNEFTVSTEPDFQLEEYYATDAYAQYLEAGARTLKSMATVTNIAFAGLGRAVGLAGGFGLRFAFEFIQGSGRSLTMSYIVTQVVNSVGERLSYDSDPDFSNLSAEDLNNARVVRGLGFVKTDDNSAIGLAGPTILIQEARDEQEPTEQLPEAAFTYAPEDPEAGQTVTFDAGQSNDPAGTIERYQWKARRGSQLLQTGDGREFEVTFPTKGNYPVTLTVVGSGERKQTESRTINVSASQSDLARFDQNGSGRIETDDLQRAIVAYNNDEEMGGKEVTTEELQQLIMIHNSDRSI